MGRSKTDYSIRNSAVGIAAKTTAIVGAYLTRVVLVRSIAAEYVGVNGMLVTVLGGLMLPNMFLDTALAYSMYRLVTQGDVTMQRAHLSLYRRIYQVFSGVILLLGVGLYFFLPLLIKDVLDQRVLHTVYWLFLLNTLLSYQWAAREMIFLATQQNYIRELFSTAFYILQFVLQCAVLVLTRSLIGFLIVEALCTAGRNISISLYAGRRYPFITQHSSETIPREEKKRLLRNIWAMLMHKSGYVIITNTDNILLSSRFGIASVGSYSNYSHISGAVNQMLVKLISGISASVGLIGASKDEKQLERVFRATLFATSWLSGFCAISLFCLLEPFVRLSFGESYLLPQTAVLVICLNFYINGVRRAGLVFRDSLGLFWKDRYKTIVEGLVNLLLSILLTRLLGLTGILLGTTLSYLSVSIWVEPLVLYRESIKTPVSSYFRKLGLLSLCVLAAAAPTWALCRLIQGGALAMLLLRGLVCLTVPNAVLLLLLGRSVDFLVLKNTLLPTLRKMLERN